MRLWKCSEWEFSRHTPITTDDRKRNNLYEPRADGRVHGDQDVFVRRSSLLLEAQKQPLLAPMVAAAALLSIAGTVAGMRGVQKS